MDARKVRLGLVELPQVLRGIRHLVVLKGKKRLDFDLRKKGIGREDIMPQMLGPTGNLRAPTIRQKDRLVVGYGEEAFQEFF